MAKDFDTILDECLDQILGGDSDLDQCMAKYPEHAKRLKELIEPLVLFRQETATQPSADAVSRGERLLLWAVEERRIRGTSQGRVKKSIEWFSSGSRRIGSSITAVPVTLTRPFRSLRMRWASIVVAAFALVLLSGGVVAASNDALPGDQLYTVKRSVERVRLVLTFSRSQEAKLQLALAERRVAEIVKLAERGQTESLTKLGGDIDSHLEQAREIIQDVSLSSSQEIARRLDDSASLQLGALQKALEEAQPNVRPALTEAFNSSATAYGDSLEAALTRATAPTVAGQLGVIQMFAAEAPSLNLDHVIVEVGEVKVHRPTDPGQEWVTIVEGPVQFDLVRIRNVGKFLGDRSIEPGTFTRVQFVINSITVVARGKEHLVDVSGRTLTFSRPFRVEAGKTTMVLLNWETTPPLQIGKTGRFNVKPVISILVHGPQGRPQPSTQQTDASSSDLHPQADSGVTTRKWEPVLRAELEGTIKGIGATSLKVSGHDIKVTPETVVMGDPAVGYKAKVVMKVYPDGSFEAVRIIVEEILDSREKAQFRGTVLEIGRTYWMVGTQRVLIGPETEIKGEANVGHMVQIIGVRLPNGSVVASQITIIRPEHRNSAGNSVGKDSLGLQQ